MSDIITRLLLKTDGFDANLKNSKQSVNSFQNDIAGMASRAGSSVAKFAGGIGIAMGAAEAFNKTIGSTQTTGDAFAKNIDQAKASVDAFFTSIAMGDFGGFLTNLENVVSKSGDLSVLLDELATKTLFSNAELNTLMLSKKMQENIAKDKTKSDKDRNTALLEARRIQLEINKLQSGLANTNQQSAYSTLDSAIAKQGLKGNVARSTWDYALKESSRPTLTNYANEYRARSEKVDNAKEINQSTGLLTDTKESRQLKKQFDAWVKTSSGRFAEFSYYFTEMDDSLASDLNKAVEMNNKANAMKGTISDANLLLNSTDAKINGSFKKKNGGDAGGGGVADSPAPSGSLAYFDAEIAKKNKELINATNTQARAAVQVTINELEAKKLNLKIRIEKDVFETVHGGMKGGELKKAGLPTQGLDTKALKLPKTKSPISKKDIKLNEEYNESLAAMGSIMSSLSGAFDGNTQSVLQWGVTLISTIGQAIPAIMGMIPAKKAEAEASKESAGAAVIDAGAKTMEAHAGIPFAGIAIGLAGVASIIAVMSSMPKFATGGVVPGVSFTGDKVHALVNSGEMILNGGQQSNLFRMLNSGGSAGVDADVLTRRLYAGIDASTLCGKLGTDKEAPKMGNVNMYIKPTETSGNDAQPREVRLRGRDIALALKNHNSKKSKVRGSDIYF